MSQTRSDIIKQVTHYDEVSLISKATLTFLEVNDLVNICQTYMCLHLSSKPSLIRYGSLYHTLSSDMEIFCDASDLKKKRGPGQSPYNDAAY